MNKKTASKLLHYILKYKLLTASSIIFSVISVISALYLPILNGRAIDYIISAGKVDFEKIIPILTEAAVMVLVGSIAQWIMTLSNNRLCFSVVRDLRQDATSVIQTLPLSYIDSHSTGDTVSLPTREEFEELMQNCTWTWTTQNDVNGYLVTSNKSGYTDRSIFLPASGLRSLSNQFFAGQYGFYWSTTASSNFTDSACSLYFFYGHLSIIESSAYCQGQCIRPVCTK